MELTQIKNNADPILQTAAQTSQKSTGASEKKSDFRGMVRQRQQESRGTQDSKSTQAQKGTVRGLKKDSAAPSGDTQEVPQEQYALAAMMLAPALDLLTMNLPAEEQNGEVEIAPVLFADTRIEAVADLPVEQLTAAGNQTAETKSNDDTGETFEFLARDASRFQDLSTAREQDDGNDETFVMEDVHYETPVFGYMDAAPVKVSSAQEAPVALETDEGVEQMGMRIQHLITEADGSGHVEFTLIPASLGKVSVEISRAADGALHIQFSATTTRAAELLQKNSDTLTRLLGADTRPNVRIEVREREESLPLFYLNPDANQEQQQRQQQQQRQNRNRREHSRSSVEFVQQLRLGLTSLNAV